MKKAPARNHAILTSCKSSGNKQVDEQLLAETGEEVNRGWAVGPFPAVPDGFVVSRRFQLIQGNSIRMIDDFTISGINDTAVSQNKIDLHMVDTFAAMIREFFLRCNEAGMASNLVAKTYDLKNVYKQIPIRTDHLCFSYFCISNCEFGRPKIYQLRILPFGTTYNVYNFLRLARILYTICTRDFFLLITNFYDDYYILANRRRTPWSWFLY